MTKQEQLAALVCASEILGGYVDKFAYDGIITEEEAKIFDQVIENIDKVAESIQHEITPPIHIYQVNDDWHGVVGQYKTFNGAMEKLREYLDPDLAEEPLEYDSEDRWGWDILNIEKIELGE